MLGWMRIIALKSQMAFVNFIHGELKMCFTFSFKVATCFLVEQSQILKFQVFSVKIELCKKTSQVDPKVSTFLVAKETYHCPYL